MAAHFERIAPMIFKNARVFLDNRFEICDVAVENRTITAIGTLAGEGMDCAGLTLLPGLVDIHSHGCAGFDFDHADEEQLKAMCSCYLRHGVTTVLATLMTNPRDLLLQAAAKCGAASAPIRGIYLEGPFFGPAKKGAHDAQYLTPIDPAFFNALDQAAGGNIRIVAVDPCLEGAEDFIGSISKTKRVTLAHTPATYDDAQKGFAAGASQVTHLFNAMTGLAHREPGLVGAALAGDCLAEVICDGIHIHPAVLKTAFRALDGRGMVISDSMAACGLEDGRYSLGGQEVTVRGPRATLADGTLAGSVTFAWDGMVNLIRAGVPEAQAVAAATAVPAKSAGLEDSCGRIAVGRQADLVLCDSHWNIRQVFFNGQAVS